MRTRWGITPHLLSMAVAVLIPGPLLAQPTMPPVVVTAPLGGGIGGSLYLGQEALVGSRLGTPVKYSWDCQ